MQNKIFIAIAAVAIVGVGGWWFLSQGPQQEPQEMAGSDNEEMMDNDGMMEDVMGGEEQPMKNPGNLEEVVVRATDSGYEPSSVTVSVGTKVMFLNESSRAVWTASDVHPTHQALPGFDALKGFATRESYSFTFEEAGTWRFHDHLRAQHTGEVIVE